MKTEEEEEGHKEVCTASGQSQKVLSVSEQTQINTVCLGCDSQYSHVVTYPAGGLADLCSTRE